MIRDGESTRIINLSCRFNNHNFYFDCFSFTIAMASWMVGVAALYPIYIEITYPVLINKSFDYNQKQVVKLATYRLWAFLLGLIGYASSLFVFVKKKWTENRIRGQPFSQFAIDLNFDVLSALMIIGSSYVDSKYFLLYLCFCFIWWIYFG